MKFDFDEWAQLAKQDNVAFEEKRTEILKQFIASCASNDNDLRRLNGLQFQINMIRRKHKSPMGACVAISEMMMDKLYELMTLDIAELILNAENKTENKTDDKIASGNVIPFKTSSKHDKLRLKN
jgi:hypothetical protein